MQAYNESRDFVFKTELGCQSHDTLSILLKQLTLSAWNVSFTAYSFDFICLRRSDEVVSFYRSTHDNDVMNETLSHNRFVLE